MPRSLNHPTFGGHLGNAPEEFSFGDGKKGATFSFAVGFSYKSKEGWINDSFWIKVSVFGRQAEYILENAEKGTYVVVCGPFSPRPYKKRDGTMAISHEMKGLEVVVMGKPKPKKKEVIEVDSLDDLPFDDEPPF